jgi:hypothetical protein
LAVRSNSHGLSKGGWWSESEFFETGRFTDDIGLGFEHRADAERFWEELRDRLQPSGLELPAAQMRRVACGPQAITNRQRSTCTAVYGRVCTVLWEDGGAPPPSYPIVEEI